MAQNFRRTQFLRTTGDVVQLVLPLSQPGSLPFSRPILIPGTGPQNSRPSSQLLGTNDSYFPGDRPCPAQQLWLATNCAAKFGDRKLSCLFKGVGLQHVALQRVAGRQVLRAVVVRYAQDPNKPRHKPIAGRRVLLPGLA